MVGIGIIGLGFMGMTHYRALTRVRGARVAALCTRDARKRSGDWRGIRGNFGPNGGRVNLSRVGTHARIEALLAELRTAVNAVRSGRAAETLSAEAAVAALRLCHREIRSARNRRIERAR